MPCKPFAMMRVLRPRPNSPRTPSCRMTSLAASAVHVSVSLERTEDGRCGLTVRDLGIVDLTIGLDHPQRVGNAVGYDGGAEANKGQAGQPHDQRVLRGLFNVLRQEVVLRSVDKPSAKPSRPGRGVVIVNSPLQTRGNVRQTWQQRSRRRPTTNSRCHSP